LTQRSRRSRGRGGGILLGEEKSSEEKSSEERRGGEGRGVVRRDGAGIYH